LKSLVTDNLIFDILVAWARTALWIILFALFIIAISWLARAYADEVPPPPVPPIAEHVRWQINQVPANLTVVWANGLQMAFPVISSTHFNYEETFKDQGGLWYFRAPCTSYQRIVRPTAILYRWGEDQEWFPYIRKTSRR